MPTTLTLCLHVTKSCCPGFIRKTRRTWSGNGIQPRRGPHLSLSMSFGEERKVVVKRKAVANPLYPTKRSGLGQPGSVVSPWVWHLKWRKLFSSLMALAPPPRNSLFLPPELISSKHWTRCQALCWACPDALDLALAPQELAVWCVGGTRHMDLKESGLPGVQW